MEEGTPAPDSLDQPLSIDHPNHNEEGGIQETPPFEKYDPLLHGGVTELLTMTSGKALWLATAASKKKEVLSIAFMTKYIQYAKAQAAPVLTKGAADWIVNIYAHLWNDNAEENRKHMSPLTAHTLKTLIRLSIVHAKAHLLPKIQQKDALAPRWRGMAPHCNRRRGHVL